MRSARKKPGGFCGTNSFGLHRPRLTFTSGETGGNLAPALGREPCQTQPHRGREGTLDQAELLPKVGSTGRGPISRRPVVPWPRPPARPRCAGRGDRRVHPLLPQSSVSCQHLPPAIPSLFGSCRWRLDAGAINSGPCGSSHFRSMDARCPCGPPSTRLVGGTGRSLWSCLDDGRFASPGIGFAYPLPRCDDRRSHPGQSRSQYTSYFAGRRLTTQTSRPEDPFARLIYNPTIAW